MSGHEPQSAAGLPARAPGPAPAVRRRMLVILLVLIGVGLAGGIPVTLEVVRAALPDGPHVVPLVLSLAQNGLLAGLAAWAFVRLGPRVGLDAPAIRARAERREVWVQLRPVLGPAVAVAVAGVAVIWVLDVTVFDAVRRALPVTDLALGAHLAGMLYGGIVEEVIARAGVLTLVALGLSRLAGRRDAPAPAWAVWAGIVAAALVFGALHLPATAALIEITPLVVARALLLNGVLAVAWGWLAWRRGLEAAIVSHLVADVLLIVPQHL